MPQGAGQVAPRGTPLLVNGVLFTVVPNAVYAVDAHDGHEIWHYVWKCLPAFQLGNRGAGIYGDWLYFETPRLPSDFARHQNRQGTLEPGYRRRQTGSFLLFPWPTIIRNQCVIAGSVGGDFLDMANYVESRDPVTGVLQLHFYTTAHKGDPGSITWPNEAAAAQGGGGVWTAPTYDPELNLLYVGTGNVETDHGRCQPSGRQNSLYVLSRRHQSGHRQTRLVFPVFSARHARLGCIADSCIDRRNYQRTVQKAFSAGLSWRAFSSCFDRTNGKNILTKTVRREPKLVHRHRP